MKMCVTRNTLTVRAIGLVALLLISTSAAWGQNTGHRHSQKPITRCPPQINRDTKKDTTKTAAKTTNTKPVAPATTKKAEDKIPQVFAEDLKGAKAPKNVKVLDEHKDGKGNIVRTIQYDEGSFRITETITQPLVTGIGVRIPINPDTLVKDSVLVYVKKSQYCVEVWYKKHKLRSYRAVFGPHPQNDKVMEGDRCTPEGQFKIANKNPASHYDKFMLLSYPNDSSYARFNKLKSEGKIPATAKIGGSVGIHGTWPGADDLIDLGVGWTDGCVALKNRDIEDLFALVGVGTRVIIKK
jgi:lipoprotein-anchoring transpeptidase ErfK/SrfK